eukprot:TRINITY_DN16453_c0_g1_i7.p1 TRINITY_DN16453_c0_g1~~TRINITY_DN16453_c0_g1_i7.p1  ORF type:complete len:477 (-),score=90.97 TRINITY_DN16453_c0_g1_i7:93-1523(-)
MSTRSPARSPDKYRYPGRSFKTAPNYGAIPATTTPRSSTQKSPRPSQAKGAMSEQSQDDPMSPQSENDDQDDQDDAPLYTSERYLEIPTLTTVVDRYKVNRRGYMGLITFTLFAALYFVVIYLQRQNFRIGTENRALRAPVFLKKPHTVITTRSGFWKFLSTVIVPYVTVGNYWDCDVEATNTNMFNHTESFQGYNVMQYSAMIGGIAIIQTRSKSKPCDSNMFLPPPGAQQHCYSEDLTTTHSFKISAHVDGDMKTMTIPYDKQSQGYVVLLPSNHNTKDMSTLLQYYQDAKLVDQYTRTVEVRIPVYNANIDVIGTLSCSVEIDLAGHMHVDLVASSIPYHLYPKDYKQIVALQIVLLLWVSMMVKNLVRAYLRTHPLPDIIKDFKINGADDGPMPAHSSGRTYVLVPGILYSTIALQVVIWIYLNYQYTLMQQLTSYDPHLALSFFKSSSVQFNTMERVYTCLLYTSPSPRDS